MTLWTEPQVEDLKVRWQDGQTCSEISRAMLRTRNAIIGKLHRLGLGNTGARQPGQPAAPKKRRRSSKNGINLRRRIAGDYSEKIMVEEPSDFKNPKRLVELKARDCHWPGEGDGADPNLLFCAAPAFDGYSYCAHHCALAYVKPGATPRAPRS